MRNFLLATSAAALALALSGQAFAETGPTTTGAATPTDSTRELVFSKDANQAKPIEPSNSGSSISGEQTAPAPQVAPDQQAATPTAQPAPTLSAEDAAVADQLRDIVENKLSQFVPREHDRASVQAFYRDRNFAPLWIEGGKAAPRAGQAAKFLGGVGADGLEPSEYPAPRFDSSEPAQLAANELALTNSVITFARHASNGRIAFSRASGAVYYDQKAPAPADVLSKVLASNNLRATLDAYNPQMPAYKALKAELAAARNGRANESPVAMPEPQKDAKASSKKKKHSRHADEHKETRSRSASVDTIIANMERWRWMPDDIGQTYVMVNVPDYTLKVVQNGKTVWQTKIVAGKPGDHATPLLTETMKYITVNPTWNVPPSIIRNEYLPALARDPGALARVGLQVGHNKDGSIRIFQPPGERNALGRIRFNFPNRFLVYQHDTPQKHLFDQTARAYSHGCMRVQYPDKYAEVLLGISQPEDKYTADRIRSMYGHSERNITLKHPIPVYITYQTAFVDDAGKQQVRGDVYGLDRDITNILRNDRRGADVPMARNYNSGSKRVTASASHSGRDRDRDRETTGSSSSRSMNWSSNYNRNYNNNNNYSYSYGYQPQWRSAFQPDRFRTW